ncbi:hypothetical protein P7K49_027413 [Saguinus oedipus]|uniref:Netrin receptor UNC5 n=1 Tax=Saguinus oedipus TaxID=9490 RepID=A0ABQ9UA61_SAGOE|nr:hypothetical protein P7K49_027413 [Saguinus oedipus]
MPLPTAPAQIMLPRNLLVWLTVQVPLNQMDMLICPPKSQTASLTGHPDHLQSDGSEVLLSPEVTCGPPDMIVTTPFALTIPHCADVSSEHWNIHLKKRTQQGKWEEVMSVEDESTSCYCLLDPFACHVLLDSFGTYALTGEPITDSAVKQLKVADVYDSYLMSKLKEQNINHAVFKFEALEQNLKRKWFQMKGIKVSSLSEWEQAWSQRSVDCIMMKASSTKDSNQIAENIHLLQSRILSTVLCLALKSNCLHYSEAPPIRNALCCRIYHRKKRDLNRALHTIPPVSPSPLQEVPFSRVWCSNRQPLHCAFSLERYTPTTTQLSCKICIRQLKGHEQILQVQTSILEVSASSTGHLTLFLKDDKSNKAIPTSRAVQFLKELQNNLAQNSSFTYVDNRFDEFFQSEREAITFFAQEDSTFPAQTGPKAFKIPYSIRQRICATFDTPNAKGKDWQMLAQKNSINRTLSQADDTETSKFFTSPLYYQSERKVKTEELLQEKTEFTETGKPEKNRHMFEKAYIENEKQKCVNEGKDRECKVKSLAVEENVRNVSSVRCTAGNTGGLETRLAYGSH